MVAHPDGGFRVDKQALIGRAVGLRRERRELPVAVQNDDIAFLDAVAAGAVEIGGADVAVRLKEIDVDIDRAAHERGQRQFADGLAVLKVMIRALAVRAEVAGQIQRSVEIRDRSAGVVADQMAAAGFGLRVEHFREIDHAITIEFVYGFHDIVPP